MENLELLSDTIVQSIRDFIVDKWCTERLDLEYVNPLLREDIFSLLDKYCTTVYYPLPNEDNNGFHCNGFPSANTSSGTFVYINTEQTTEKQIFTAAHELGHIWNVDTYLKERLMLTLDYVSEERIMNRFAAELLMPERLFRDFTQKKLLSFGETITVAEMLNVISAIMDEYFVPYKAVIWRLYELDFISDADFRFLLSGNRILPVELIKAELRNIIRENGYTKLLNATHKKWIKDFPDNLKRVAQNGSLSMERITHLRRLLDIPTDSPDSAFDFPMSE